MEEVLKSEITAAVLDLLVEVVPDISTREMYGGTVFEMEQDTPKSRIGGVYSYDAYVSIEFALGATFDDPNGHLEGSGKKRRHVKLHSLGDLDAKHCRDFLGQAVQAQKG